MNFLELYDKSINSKGGVRPYMDECYKKYNSGDIKTDPFNGFFIPGTIYTFDYYDKEWLSSVKKNSKLYYDYKPLIFCLNNTPSNKEMIGINLNIMPLAARRRFFYFISKAFGRNKHGFEYPQFSKIPLTIDKLPKVYDLKSDIAINNYSKNKMNNLKIISWEEFPVIVFLNTKKMLYARKMNSSFIEKQL